MWLHTLSLPLPIDLVEKLLQVLSVFRGEGEKMVLLVASSLGED